MNFVSLVRRLWHTYLHPQTNNPHGRHWAHNVATPVTVETILRSCKLARQVTAVWPASDIATLRSLLADKSTTQPIRITIPAPTFDAPTAARPTLRLGTGGASGAGGGREQSPARDTARHGAHRIKDLGDTTSGRLYLKSALQALEDAPRALGEMTWRQTRKASRDLRASYA